MAFTNIEKVRLHLIGPTGNDRQIRGERVVIPIGNKATLNNFPVTKDSARVKGILGHSITGTSIILEGESWTVFAPIEVIPDSIAVVDSIAFRVSYAEGIDYLIDYELGRIRRLSGSAIASGQGVTIYFQTYKVYSEGVDYLVELDTGLLLLIPTGSMKVNQSLWVDYSVAESAATEALLTDAIEMAHQKIVARLESPYTGTSSDPLLMIGETELACAIAARAIASKPLGLTRDATSDDRALAWMSLADKFEQSGWQTLQGFLRKAVHRSGIPVKNR